MTKFYVLEIYKHGLYNVRIGYYGNFAELNILDEYEKPFLRVRIRSHLGLWN